MKSAQKIIWEEGLLTGTLFCIGVLAYLRVSPALSSEDYPEITRNEILALENHSSDIYEQLLTAVLVLTPMIWGIYRILNKLIPVFEGLSVKRRYFNLYLGLVIWNFIIFNMDLIIVDWLIICFLKAPISGIEHLLSKEAISSYQSYGFHFREHYLFVGSYLVNLLSPILMITLYVLIKRVKNRLNQKNTDQKG